MPKPPDGDLLLIYADDTLIASSGARASGVNLRLNAYLATLAEYFKKWGIRLNAEKSKGIIFKGKRKHLYRNSRQFIPTLRVGDSTITIADNIKYLGVIYNERFEFYRHTDYILCKVKGIFAMYLGILRKRAGLDIRVKLLVYKQIIRPLLAYAFPAWFSISSAQMERIRIWERKVLSSCLGLTSTIGENGILKRPSCAQIYDAVDFDRIDIFLVRSALTFLDRSEYLDNELVRQSRNAANDPNCLSGNYLPPASLLELRRQDLLYVNDRLLFYHRRFGTLNILDTVYNTNQ